VSNSRIVASSTVPPLVSIAAAASDANRPLSESALNEAQNTRKRTGSRACVPREAGSGVVIGGPILRPLFLIVVPLESHEGGLGDDRPARTQPDGGSPPIPTPTWTFEPGHTEAGFRARHMMVTWVHGLFKDVHGKLRLDWDQPLSATFSGEIDATKLWTGEADRDAHLRSADFFDVDNHPTISFAGGLTERTGDIDFKGQADLTIRGITRQVGLDVA